MAHPRKKTAKSKELVKEKLRQKKKAAKKIIQEKRARLFVKNLPFKATEKNLKEHFEQYGEIVNVEILKRPDGKLVGCGFIQFKLVQKAAKAKHYTNGKQFMGREIVVDFAKARKEYKKDINQPDNSNKKKVTGGDNENIIEIDDETKDNEDEDEENDEDSND